MYPCVGCCLQNTWVGFFCTLFWGNRYISRRYYPLLFVFVFCVLQSKKVTNFVSEVDFIEKNNNCNNEKRLLYIYWPFCCGFGQSETDETDDTMNDVWWIVY
eukprot:m.9790 g.9790  ORF g.9790 m.9790 type:complete len:102 (-) comp6425_c0_seq1:1268-1573(-)